MKNLENRVVYLNHSGAQRMFSNPAITGLPVIPTDPTNVDGTYVYGDTFTEHNGALIGGCISQDAFNEDSPGEEATAAAIAAYFQHREMLEDRFGPRDDRTVDVEALKNTAQTDPIPTLRERQERRQKEAAANGA